jgi:hypothetical protein
LVKCIHGRTVNRHGKRVLLEALEGDVQQSDRDMLSQYTRMFDIYNAQKHQCLVSMIEICKTDYAKAFGILLSIPGIKEQSAVMIISETETHMSLFATAAAIVSWAGLRPRNEESAGKIKSRKITHGNKYLRKALMECAWGAARTFDSVFYNRFIHLKSMRKHNNDIVVAIARKILVIAWTLLSKDEYFDKDYHLKNLSIPA